ncbi:LytR/AlgR family response regulator transcription factor [Butyribacter sp.]|uniref:LytR/AlgR family response regulator transcription factor n=1 Tax=Butyribacter sp. TaxID=2822465 RepID=UPI002A960584|nr:LytTR family DNA-binding domain-containing protein [Butyribacter sp.]
MNKRGKNMEIRIAICDDEVTICSQLEKTIIDILEEKNIEVDLQTFVSGEDLCKEFQKKDYDLVFLDIELPKINGIGIGKYIRENLKNEIIQIAYISAKSEYAMELFAYRPINFLVKPLSRKKIEEVIDKYLVVTEQNNYAFSYKKNKQYYNIPMSEIIYLESRYRKVKIHMRDKEDEFYGSLEKIYQNLKRKNFLFIHKSIIVNYNFVKKMSYDEVILFNDIVLPISQSRRSAIRKMYMEIRRKEI